MDEKIIVIGGKGTAINIAEHILDAQRKYGSQVELLGFAIDDESLGESIHGIPILCGVREAIKKHRARDVKFLFALYRPDLMEERVRLLKDLGLERQRCATFVHPSSYISPSTELGAGSVVLSNVSLNSGVVVGACNIINANVVIEHDTVLGDYNFIGASTCVGANVTIDQGCFTGLGSVVRENTRIESYSFIGMGANVLKDVAPGTTVIGNPARRVK